MPQNCLGTIRSYYPKFSEKEKKIADYILDKPEVVIHRTINEVADDLNIADATVFRFSKRIGFKGFQAMKIALASETIAPIPASTEESLGQKNEQALTEKIFKASIRTLQNTLKHMDSSALKQAQDAIMKASRVDIYGVAGSVVIAQSAAQKLLNTGIRAVAFADPHTQLLSASTLTTKDVALLISPSEENSDLKSILEAVRKSGAKTIAICEYCDVPSDFQLDVLLSTSSDETDPVSVRFTSQLAQLALIDALCYNIIHHTADTDVSMNTAIK